MIRDIIKCKKIWLTISLIAIVIAIIITCVFLIIGDINAKKEAANERAHAAKVERIRFLMDRLRSDRENENLSHDEKEQRIKQDMKAIEEAKRTE